MSLATVLTEIESERGRQDRKFGAQNCPDGTGGIAAACRAFRSRSDCDAADGLGRKTWRHILDEEVAEALAETEADRLRAELVQVAAVAVAWIEAIDRRASC